MISRGSADLRRELCTAARGQFVRVRLDQETMRASSKKDSPTLGDAVDARLAEDIGKTRETIGRNARQHLADEQIDVRLARCGSLAVLERNLVRAEKRRHDAHRQLVGESRD